MIAFKPMASSYDDCSYHQVKTLIDFWCRRDLNLSLQQKTLPLELAETHSIKFLRPIYSDKLFSLPSEQSW